METHTSSNTKTKLFLDFASATKPFRKIIEASSTKTPNAIKVLEQLPQDQGTSLGNAADMLLTLTEGLTSLPDLPTRKGTLSSASLSTTTKLWTANCTTKNDAGEESQLQVHSPLLVLCTGSAPTPPYLPIALPKGLTPLFLDTALQPSILKQHISPEQTTTIAIIGASHSAILCLMNLSNLAMTSHPNLHIKWFTRHPLRYAEYRDGWILRDNTGLKGEAATWARENLEEETFESSPVSKFIEKITYKREDENTTFEKHLPGCDKYVAAIGYTKNPLPRLERDGEVLGPVFNHETGGFSNGEEGENINGLFGAGIAFPERVVDPEGNVEYAVGFWKFVKFVKRVSPGWN